MASTSKFLAQMNKTQDVGRATKGRSAYGLSTVGAERKGRIASHSALLNLPRPLVVGAFCVHGSDEQIFGADEQAPKGGRGRGPKNALWTRELLRAMLMVAFSAGGDGGRKAPELSAQVAPLGHISGTVH